MEYVFKQLSISDEFVDNPQILVIEDITDPTTKYVDLNEFCLGNVLKLVTIVQNKRTTLGIFERVL